MSFVSSAASTVRYFTSWQRHKVHVQNSTAALVCLSPRGSSAAGTISHTSSVFIAASVRWGRSREFNDVMERKHQLLLLNLEGKPADCSRQEAEQQVITLQDMNKSAIKRNTMRCKPFNISIMFCFWHYICTLPALYCSCCTAFPSGYIKLSLILSSGFTCTDYISSTNKPSDQSFFFSLFPKMWALDLLPDSQDRRANWSPSRQVHVVSQVTGLLWLKTATVASNHLCCFDQNNLLLLVLIAKFLWSTHKRRESEVKEEFKLQEDNDEEDKKVYTAEYLLCRVWN